MDPQDAIALVAIFQLLIGGLIFTTYKDVEWYLVLPVIFGAVAGTGIGMYFLGALDPYFLRWFLALFILSFLIKNRFFPSYAFSRASLTGGMTSGLLSGFFQGSLGLGGPNLVIYFKELSKDKNSFRAHAILLLSISNLVRIILAPMTHMFSSEILTLSVYILPFFLLGVFYGNSISKIISPKTYSFMVEVLLSISFLCLVFKNLFVL